MGYMSWNMVINKATISCLLNPDHPSSNWLFPMRLILERNPNDLFFQNCFENLNNEDESQYLGFFLIKYNLPKEEIIPDGTEEECKHLYSFAGSKPHRSKEQYYVMFVFKNLNQKFKFKPFKYFIVNFRCNAIPWGDTGELTKALSSEIRQINCLYVNDKVKLYLLLKKKTSENIETIEDICKSQYEEEEKIRQKREKKRKGIVHESVEAVEDIELRFKKSYLDCNEAWLHKQTFDLLIENNFLPYSEQGEKTGNMHVLCTKKNINEILSEFNKIDTDIIMQKTENSDIDIIEYIDLNNGYILTECHFIWEADDEITKQSRELYDNHMKSYEDHMQSYDKNSIDFEKISFKSTQHYLEDKRNRLLAEYLDNQKKNKRFLIKHGHLDANTKEEYRKNFCITSNCMKLLDSVRFNTLQSYYNADDNEKEIYSPDFILNTTFANIEQSFQINPAEQTGGNDNLSKLKFNKYVKKYYELVDIYDKDYKNNKNNNLPFHNNKFTNLPFYNNLIDNNFNNSKLFYNKDNIIKNGENILQNTNFITTVGVGAMFYLGHIKLNNILIITHNIVYADKILHVFKNIIYSVYSIQSM